MAEEASRRVWARRRSLEQSSPSARDSIRCGYQNRKSGKSVISAIAVIGGRQRFLVALPEQLRINRRRAGRCFTVSGERANFGLQLSR